LACLRELYARLYSSTADYSRVIGREASAELRHNFGVSFHGAWQTIAFVDSGFVRVDKNVFKAGDNKATLSGAGIWLELGWRERMVGFYRSG
jgi:hypothetical protein